MIILKPSLTRRGVINFISLLVLLVGIPLGIYLAITNRVFQSGATLNASKVEVIGPNASQDANGNYHVSSPNVSLRITYVPNSPVSSNSPSCDPNQVNMSVSPNPVTVGSNITFNLSGGSQGNSGASDSFPGTSCASNSLNGFGSKSCLALQGGTFTWTHNWTIPSGSCSKTYQYTISGSTGILPEPVLTCKGSTLPWSALDSQLHGANYPGPYDHTQTELDAFNRAACPGQSSLLNELIKPVLAQTNSTNTVGVGSHCGGFIQNPPQCASGLICVTPQGVPGDVGGTCQPVNQSSTQLGMNIDVRDTHKIPDAAQMSALNPTWLRFVIPTFSDCITNAEFSGPCPTDYHESNYMNNLPVNAKLLGIDLGETAWGAPVGSTDVNKWNRYTDQIYLPTLTRVLSTYGSKLSAIEIWNEEDYSGVKIPAEAYGYMLAKAAALIKSTNPSIKVITGGMSPPDPNTGLPGSQPQYIIDTISSAKAQDQNVLNNIDGIGLHPYEIPEHSALLTSYINNFGDSIKGAGINKPFWITEIGVPDFTHTDSPKNQSEFLSNQITQLTSLSDKAPVVIWFAFIDGMDGNWGLYDSSGVIKDSGKAFSTFTVGSNPSPSAATFPDKFKITTCSSYDSCLNQLSALGDDQAKDFYQGITLNYQLPRSRQNIIGVQFRVNGVWQSNIVTASVIVDSNQSPSPAPPASVILKNQDSGSTVNVLKDSTIKLQLQFPAQTNAKMSVDNTGVLQVTQDITSTDFSNYTALLSAQNPGNGTVTVAPAIHCTTQICPQIAYAPLTFHIIVSSSPIPPPTASESALPLFRLWNSKNSDHFYTPSDSERDAATRLGYAEEGSVGMVLPESTVSALPLYRLWSLKATDHFYTTSDSEKLVAQSIGYIDEGISGYIYSSPQPNTHPLYRLWSFNALDHFYTDNPNERSAALRIGYSDEGITGYLLDNQAPIPSPCPDGKVPVPAGAQPAGGGGNFICVTPVPKVNGQCPTGDVQYSGDSSMCVPLLP